jgi:hypothetical protein
MTHNCVVFLTFGVQKNHTIMGHACNTARERSLRTDAYVYRPFNERFQRYFFKPWLCETVRQLT